MDVLVPHSISEALKLKTRYPQARWIAGGTDLMPQWRSGVALPSQVISLRQIADLYTIDSSDDAVRIGGCVSHAQIAASPKLRLFSALQQAAKSVGAPAVRNMGTIAGNIANGSPSADLPPALMIYDAQIVLASVRGTRKISADKIYLGYRALDIQPDELITAVELPIPSDRAYSGFYKVGTRSAQSISKASLAGLIELSEDGKVSKVRLAAGSVAPTPIRLYTTESVLQNKYLDDALIESAQAAAKQEVSPIDDIRSTAEYRRHVIGVLVRRFLQSSLETLVNP